MLKEKRFRILIVKRDKFWKELKDTEESIEKKVKMAVDKERKEKEKLLHGKKKYTFLTWSYFMKKFYKLTMTKNLWSIQNILKPIS